jgi:hypothetical protein
MRACMNVPRCLIAVPASGAGKTTFAVGLMAALAWATCSRLTPICTFLPGPSWPHVLWPRRGPAFTLRKYPNAPTYENLYPQRR